MDGKYGKACSPCGDVTDRGEYQAAANDILKSIFKLGKSKEVQDAERNIQILKITNHPVNYLAAKALYEIRTSQERKVPSDFVETSSPMRRRAGEYAPWSVDCPDLSGNFVKQHKETQVPGSDFLEVCDSCNAKGYIPCSCGNGQETCYTCRGDGRVTCHSCGGSGEVICSFCGGRGEIGHTEYRGGGTDGPAETITVWQQCSGCGGSGRVNCGTCGGYGQLTCSTCGGSGVITCRSCGGTMKLTCNDCDGHGYFLHTVCVVQDVDTTSALELLDGYQIDNQRYSKQNFVCFEPNANDRLLYSAVDTTPMEEIPLNYILPAQYTEPYSVSRMMSDLTSSQKIRSAGAKYIRFLVEVYQRDVLEITYQFQGDTYYLQADLATGEYLMDENPYGNVAASLLKKLESHYRSGELRSFRDAYDEFSVVSSASNIALGEADAKPMMNKIKRKCYILPIVASIVVYLLLSLVLPGRPMWILVSVGLLSAACSALIAHLTHMRLMLDKKNLTYGILAGLGVIISVALRVVVNYLL